MLPLQYKWFAIWIHSGIIIVIASMPPESGLTSSEVYGQNFFINGSISPAKSRALEVKDFLKIDTFMGFFADLTGIFSFANDQMATAPKYTVDDVMTKMDSEFAGLSNQMDNIQNQLSKAEYNVYKDVELAVITASNAIKFQSTANLNSNANILYNNLDIFLKGLLGITTIAPDILKAAKDISDCGSRSIYNQVDKFITLVNMGAMGIGYYSQKINNKTKFNGNVRAKTLNDNKKAVLCRVRKVQRECMSKNKDTIGQYVSKILKTNTNTDIESMSKALYNKFDDIYQAKINWIFYVAKDFEPTTDKRCVGCNQKSAKMGFFGEGVSGETRFNSWIVYWAGEPTGASGTLTVNDKAVEGVVDDVANRPYQSETYIAERIYDNIADSFLSGRKPVIRWVFVNPPESATIGKPVSRLDFYFGKFKKYFKYPSRVPGGENYPVHVIIQ